MVSLVLEDNKNIFYNYLFCTSDISQLGCPPESTHQVKITSIWLVISQLDCGISQLLSQNTNASQKCSRSSSRTDHCVYFQQTLANDCLCTLELCTRSMITTRTFGGFSAQCLSKLFLKEFTVRLLTTFTADFFC